jgi:hypothetical protein
MKSLQYGIYICDKTTYHKSPPIHFQVAESQHHRNLAA